MIVMCFRLLRDDRGSGNDISAGMPRQTERLPKIAKGVGI